MRWVFWDVDFSGLYLDQHADAILLACSNPDVSTTCGRSCVAHVIGMPRPAPNVFRVTGTALTWGCIVVVSGWVLWLRRGQ